MTERHDHRDAETRAADSKEPEVIDAPVLDGADDLQTEANRAIEDGADDPEAAGGRGTDEG